MQSKSWAQVQQPLEEAWITVELLVTHMEGHSGISRAARREMATHSRGEPSETSGDDMAYRKLQGMIDRVYQPFGKSERANNFQTAEKSNIKGQKEFTAVSPQALTEIISKNGKQQLNLVSLARSLQENGITFSFGEAAAR